MKIKRILWTILSILAIFTLIAAAPAASKEVYIKAGASKDVQVGSMGVHVTNSYYTGHLTVAHRTKEPVVGTSRLKPIARMIDARFKDLNGNTITHINGAWYVFYNLTPKETKLFNNKKIAIFYYDPWPKKWRECNTWKVYGTENRISCRIVNFGLYGLGYR